MGNFIVPVWVEQGPGPEIMQSSGYTKAAGAIEAIAIDQMDNDRVFVATVNGGVWRSFNAISAVDPFWEPLTDQMPCLSISAIAFDEYDGSRNILYAGCGDTSHAYPLVGGTSGPLGGIYKTSDGGNTWTEIGRNTFQGFTVSKILPRQLTLLVATRGRGLMRSDDGGINWVPTAFIAGNYLTDLAHDPGYSKRIYISGPSGIFRSDDGGNLQWVAINNGLGMLPANADIRVSVSPVADYAGNHNVFAVVGKWKTGGGLFVSKDFGANWMSMGMPTDGSSPVFPLVASASLNTVVFCTSDSGVHWMVTDNLDQTFTWMQVDFAGAGGTAPHTDGRSCAFSADAKTLFDTNDGGIYRLHNPHGRSTYPPRRWDEAVGNIRITEFHAVSYDAVHQIIFGACQDNSIPQQTAPGGIEWGINEDTWGDGFETGVDNSSIPGASIHYSSQQNFFHSNRRTYTSPTTVSVNDTMKFTVAGTGGLHYNQVEGALTPAGGLGTVQWNQGWVINEVDPSRILLGTDYLYESFDRGDNFTSLGGLAKNNNGDWIPANPVGRVSAYAYGHIYNADVMYIGAGNNLWMRSVSTGAPVMVNTYPGSGPIAIVIDPIDWQRVYVADNNGTVWRTIDAGNTAAGWKNFSGNLATLSMDIRTIGIIYLNNDTTVLLAGGYGGVFACITPRDNRFAFWQKFGFNFPNGLVTKIIYNKEDDVLIAGTLGRSAWSLPQVTKILLSAPSLSIVQTARGQCYGGWAEQSTISLVAKVQGIQDLVAPLNFAWNIPGIWGLPVLNTNKLSFVLPPAGTELLISLVVTDATGYKISAYLTGFTISAREAFLRSRICQLINELRLLPIPWWEWDPEFTEASRPLERHEFAQLENRLQQFISNAGSLLQDIKNRG